MMLRTLAERVLIGKLVILESFLLAFVRSQEPRALDGGRAPHLSAAPNVQITKSARRNPERLKVHRTP